MNGQTLPRLGVVESAGERTALECGPRWLAALLREGCDGALEHPDEGRHTLRVRVEASPQAFDVAGWEPVGRGVWAADGAVVVEDVCSSGFDLLLGLEPEPCFTFRWRPRPATWVLNRALRRRFRLLAREVLLQYPALWIAGGRGRAPLHAPACTTGGRIALLAGPGGLGKSTLVMNELRHGGCAVSDNLSVSDGVTVWGVVEPVRLPWLTGDGDARRRTEKRLWPRTTALRPELVVRLRRGRRERPSVHRCSPASTAASLVAGTYMAGELRRYWGFAATLAEGIGSITPHPPVEGVAADLTSALPCMEVELAGRPGPLRLADLLAGAEVPR